MEQIPTLIQDLALILLIAAVVSLLFKWLKQPVVLGYIVAGFIAGPHFIYTPSVHDSGSIDIWAQIGVIILLFTLGLEFSFKKILKMGAAPVIAALTIIFCMMFLGTSVGHLFGWKSMDCIYLGGMLAMSSTTIIYKAFQDLGVLQKKFAGVVLSVLILEDILAIVLMVMLSTLAVSHNIEGEELIEGLLRLGFFLILWFVVGLYLIPIILRKNRKFLNSETLLIVSLALCFVMAVVAVESGFSAAFGAFVVGSILAETVEAERIEKLVAPVKDLFGAIFFVSVGMLVDPEVLVEYAWPIAALTLTIIVGQAFFGTFGFVLAGQPLKEAMKCGFSMSQIGEFAFIIASWRRQTSGFILQDFRLYPEYTVRDNILIPFYLDHRAPDEQMLHKLTEILGIAGKLHSRPAQLSGGQQQRVAIARALIAKPRIVFADEPTGNLDTRTGEDTMRLLMECAAEFGQTLIVVTHNPEIAQKAQQVIQIEDGQILRGELQHEKGNLDTQ